MITIIGLSLMPVAAHWAMGGNPQAADYGSMGNIGLAGLSLVIVLALSKLGNAMISRLSILLAIVIGTAVAAMIGKSDFSGWAAVRGSPCPCRCTSAGRPSAWRRRFPCPS